MITQSFLGDFFRSIKDVINSILGGSQGGAGGSPGAVPEIDGPAGIAAIALVVSVAIVLYNRSRE